MLTGILIVLGIAIVAALLGLAAHLLLHRFGRTRPETQERRPHRPGRVGRISKQQGP
jgi:hypothetical protein